MFPPACTPPFFCLFFNRMVVGMALGGGVALIFRISVVRGGTLSLSYIHNRHSHRWGRGLLHPYHIFRIGVVRGGGASSISYIQNKRRQGVGIHPYHIFMIGAVKKGASSLSYIQNRRSQRVGIHPYHIFMIVVVKGGGVGLHPYHIFTISIVRGWKFIHIIYS